METKRTHSRRRGRRLLDNMEEISRAEHLTTNSNITDASPIGYVGLVHIFRQQVKETLPRLGALARLVQIAMSCFLAVASAGYYDGAPAHGGQYQGPLHIPVLDHNGVPVEPKEVQEARKNHLAAFSGVQTAPAHNYGYTAPQQHYQPQYNAPQHNYQSQHVPVIDAQGVPQDALDVAAVKAAHFAAYAQVNARAAPAGIQNYGYRHYHAAPAHYAPAGHNAGPIDTPEVAAAKAAHFAAHAQVAQPQQPHHYNQW
ncbi:hypothetical protein CBL_00307 [Carabus blaptoides fortunei]